MYKYRRYVKNLPKEKNFFTAFKGSFPRIIRIFVSDFLNRIA